MSLSTVTQERVKVLIVDDNEDQRNLLRRHFEIAGCEVTDAATAESAISVYGDLDLDLAVIDLMLPGMDGWALSERLLADVPDCPVAISSVLDQENYPPMRAALPKPVTRASVREVLLNCVPRWIAP
ncbi:response regulator [Parafrigoribacterium humi]|jgi:CheY-like chemotaxis protein|uniref:response regulator n=1 Tax=Parafrigoribacterium humi TaxID=3144664 RepID=UPI0032EB517B